MDKYLEDIHHHKDVISQFRAGKSTKKVPEAFQKQRTLDELEE